MFTSRLEPSPDLGSSRQESAKNAPRGLSLESSRLVDPCPSLLEPPRDSSPLVDPCSSRQEAACQETRVWLECARLVHYTNLDSLLSGTPSSMRAVAILFEASADAYLTVAVSGICSRYSSNGMRHASADKRLVFVE